MLLTEEKAKPHRRAAEGLQALLLTSWHKQVRSLTPITAFYCGIHRPHKNQLPLARGNVQKCCKMFMTAGGYEAAHKCLESLSTCHCVAWHQARALATLSHVYCWPAAGWPAGTLKFLLTRGFILVYKGILMHWLAWGSKCLAFV